MKCSVDASYGGGGRGAVASVRDSTIVRNTSTGLEGNERVRMTPQLTIQETRHPAPWLLVPEDLDERDAWQFKSVIVR